MEGAEVNKADVRRDVGVGDPNEESAVVYVGKEACEVAAGMKF